MVNRAPIYCDIGDSVDLLSLERSLTLRHRTATRIQVAQNVAIPASSLCINRRLCKIATAKVAMTTSAERRRAVIQDLLIGLGIPILQIIVGECAQLFIVNCQRVVYMDATQNTLSRRIVTTSMRILALSSVSCLRR